ncbi:N-acetylneuraminate synthase [Labilibaculum manganireducens]|uniref:N-acetylneuraminate synthase n=1 Tax=Labilibaculum manganireducens TaxID=1940525 RepID=A0A2N3IEW6_9BACT|nr:N-acetylneuraminate synthase [Labilibaculum manganireducens]PKQ68849.1 N-acetylneuraminate synthase [Labilibaculum manganireducens]
MNRTLIIAEAGVNHNGSLERAKRMVDVAAIAGVDYIKFQTFKAEALVSKGAKQAEYQTKNLGGKNDSQYEMLKALELSETNHDELIEYCHQKGVGFLSTAFDMMSLDYLNSLNIPFWKIPSGELTNLPYLQKIASLDKDIVLSTGMADLSEIEAAINVLEKNGSDRSRMTILHCNTEYPTPMCDVNLKAMITIQEAFKTKIGYSDHTLGIEVAIAAVALGATVIEKHFTLDRNLEGPDHKASLEPDELKQMVKCIRNIENAMGDGVKRPSASEMKNKIAARKSIVADCAIKKGDVFSETNLSVKRPGNGISPMLWNEILGKTADRDYKADDLI